MLKIMKKGTLVFLIVTFAFSQINAQQNDLTGKWQIVNFGITMTTDPDTVDINGDSIRIVRSNNEAELRADASVWTLELLDSAQLIQTSNMRTGDLESQFGTWSISADTLGLNMAVGKRKIVIKYVFVLIDKELHLQRQNPKRTMRINSVFHKED
jgi:hypothetical protein